MYNVNITSIKSYEFKGTISDDQLTDSQLESLGLKRDSEYINDVDVEGCFSIEWDDDIPMPVIDSCFIVGGPNGKTVKGFIGNAEYTDLETKIKTVKPLYGQVPDKHTLELDLDQLNLESMESEISEWDNGDWSADRIASMADYYYDMDR